MTPADNSVELSKLYYWVVKACSPIKLNDGCTTNKLKGTTATICNCSTDKCNYATFLKLSLIAVTALFFAY